ERLTLPPSEITLL
nr:Chain C, Chains: C,D [Mus musculus]6Y38_D Chain D, Chains: C,D [Mus musculus]6Y9N_B Chain B, Unconventional myosin-XV [Mus musculus]